VARAPGDQIPHQLEEEPTWVEGSTFESSEDVTTGGDVMFRYVAAELDQRGKSDLTRLLDLGRPAQQELDAVFAEASRWSFGGRFPHLLLERAYGYRSRGTHLDRYGSVFRLVEEVTTVRAAIVDAQSSVIQSSAAGASTEQVRVAAWQTSSAILRLATIAAAKHLPLWTTG
jgi:hypothetical protein